MACFRCLPWLLAALLLPGVAQGQEVLTLEQVVAATLANNASLRVARAGQAAAAARVTEARSGFWPRVSVTESWQRGDSPIFVFSSLLSSGQFAASNFAIDSLNRAAAIGFFQGRLAVEQTVFDGGQLTAAVSTARLQRESADHATTESAARLAETAAAVYARLVAADADERAAEAGARTADEDVTRAARRRDAGLATEADVLALAVHVADLRERAITARARSIAARAELNRLMGVPVDRPLRVADPIPATRAVRARPLAELLSQAEARRPELLRAAADLGIAREAQRQARAAWLPSVSAVAAVDVSGTAIGDRTSSWLAGLHARWTLSTGGAEAARRLAALHRETQARASYDDMRSAVHVEVVSALGALEAAHARETAGRAAVKQARESQRIIRDRYDAGLAPVNDVLRASSALVEAEARRAAAMADVIASEARLRRAAGDHP